MKISDSNDKRAFTVCVTQQRNVAVKQTGKKTAKIKNISELEEEALSIFECNFTQRFSSTKFHAMFVKIKVR